MTMTTDPTEEEVLVTGNMYVPKMTTKEAKKLAKRNFVNPHDLFNDVCEHTGGDAEEQEEAEEDDFTSVKTSVRIPKKQNAQRRRPQEIPQVAPEGMLEYMVLDSNALIRGHGFDLHNRAKRIVTIAEVLAEIRDAKARELLARLPFTLEIMNPSPQSIKEVSQFATATGDFGALSATDLRLIALTHMLHTEAGGKIRNPPSREVAAKAAASQRAAALFKAAASDSLKATDYTVQDDAGSDDEADAVEEVTEQMATLSTEVETPAESSAPKSWANVAVTGSGSLEHTEQSRRIADNVARMSAEAAASRAPVQIIPAATPLITPKDTSKEDGPAREGGSAILSLSSVNRENESRQLREADDGIGWVSSDNMNSFNAFDAFNSVTGAEKAPDAAAKEGELDTIPEEFTPVDGKKKKNKKNKNKNGNIPVVNPKDIKVGIYTTDFSMQNVMLQMGLYVLAADGMLVRTARTWVLRCIGCANVHTKDLTRLFCSSCGGYNLTRVSASLTPSGEMRLHLRRGYQVNTAGFQYSLPAPGKQGRFDGEILLREDQLLSGIWRQKSIKITRDVKSAFGDDVTGDLGIHINKHESGLKVGLGKGNVNARKGRERRGAKRK